MYNVTFCLHPLKVAIINVQQNDWLRVAQIFVRNNVSVITFCILVLATYAYFASKKAIVHIPEATNFNNFMRINKD